MTRMMISKPLVACICAGLIFFQARLAQGWDDLIRDGATGAALGCLLGKCQRKNVARGAAAGVIGLPILRRVLGPSPVVGGYAGEAGSRHGGPCSQYAPDTSQRERCQNGAAQARQRS